MGLEQWVDEQILLLLARRKIDKSYDRGYIDALLDVRTHIAFLAYLTQN